ncbi:MAG: type I methionyl aminopeptidase [Phycisphaeraceae bacterium]
MVIRKTPEQIEKMRAAGRVVHKVHQRMQEMCKPGVTTRELDDEAQRVIDESGAEGLFKWYPTYKPGTGFPATLCISVNEEVVHGIASDRQIKDGDVVGVDCGVRVDGWCGDAANTILVGDVKDDVRRMCEACQRCLEIAIENVRPGRKWSQVARLMQKYAEGRNYGVVREFVGHGIGQKMHEEPKVPNYVSRQTLRDDIDLREGIVLAIEPMLTLGRADTKILSDGWTVVTKDKKASAHYEHTVAVTRDGADVLTDGR